MNFIKNIFKNGIGLFVLFLLVFIPLYPKLPLIDIKNTWVYIRAEDFVVFFTLVTWIVLLIKGKVTLKTPLTLPILVYWIVGAIATIHGVVIIFPQIANVFPNVALLSYLRHIEYVSLFFVAYSAVKSRKFAFAAIWTIVVTLLGVVAYGFGQRYLSFPAYLTMNEEYAKGIPIIISPLNRVSSTFAGHYDLAAYLVLIIPILVSLAFGFRNLFIKLALLAVSVLGIGLMVLTVSRVSFFVLFIGLFFVLLFHKRKWLLYAVPLVVIAGGVFLYSQSSLLSRFSNTVEEIDVLVDARTGGAVGHVRYEPRTYLYDKIVEPEGEADPLPPTPRQISYAVSQGIPLSLATYMLPQDVAVVEAEITSTGENLPQGTSYINLSLSPIIDRFDMYFLELPLKEGSTSATLSAITGEYLVKRASAYDLSFTTRFQGGWPRAIEAFNENILLGSGYGSVSLAVDNNYYRMLGETGLVGTFAFIAIFVVVGIYIRKVLPNVDSPALKSFVLGYAAGVIGLALNATLIDVFEASKVAFVLWLITGVVVGTLFMYQTRHFNVYKELGKALTSTYAIIVYLLLLTITIFSTSINSYFIGDDFTWFRWASACGESNCFVPSKIAEYFFNSEGFFYRPGTKTYFLLMYPLFWLNQVVYHIASIALHFVVVVLLYLLAKRIFKNSLLSAASAFIFLIISGYLEIVLWISATGHLFNAVFILLSLHAFIIWYESRKWIFFVGSLLLSLVSLMFYELGMVTPLLALSYILFKSDLSLNSIASNLKNKIYLLLFVPQIVYLVVRFFSHTFWFSGDYNYNLVKLPFNFIGNLSGYLLIAVGGPYALPFYENLREVSRSNYLVAIVLALILLGVAFYIFKALRHYFTESEKKIIIFSLMFFVISLLPFLGFGNISFRYSYLASFGIIMLGVLLTKKLYSNIFHFGRDVAFLVVLTLVSVFSLVHIIQSQQLIIDWNGAGGKVERFLLSIDQNYQEDWSTGDANIYFVNVMVKNNNAWVFPWGLEDALWFAFKNEGLNIYRVQSIADIPMPVFTTLGNWVFEFQFDGSLKRILLEDVTENEENI